jgi:hypothetical protein
LVVEEWLMTAVVVELLAFDELKEERFMRGVVDTEDSGDEEPDECTVISFCSSWIICSVDEERFAAVSSAAEVVVLTPLAAAAAASAVRISCCCWWETLLGEDSELVGAADGLPLFSLYKSKMT